VIQIFAHVAMRSTYEYRCAPITTEEPTRQNRTEQNSTLRCHRRSVSHTEMHVIH